MSCSYNILIGPLYHASFLGRYIHDPHVKAFVGQHWRKEWQPHLSVEFPPQCYDIRYAFPEAHFDDVLAQLPGHWTPDVVIWFQLLHSPIPTGIEHCPYPTLVIVSDWSASFSMVWQYVSAFDFILCDHPLLLRLQQAGIHNCRFWSCYSFDPERYYRDPEEERIYDISFLGTVNSTLHPERMHYLRRVSALSKQYRVLIDTDLFGEAYRQILNQSKIVLNHSIRQEINLRAYEVPACGALLFMEDSNLDIRGILPDQEACILYNSDNLEELLHYYLSHEEERDALAQAGYERIQAFSYEKQFEQLLAMLPDILENIGLPKERPFHFFSDTLQKRVMAHQLFHAAMDTDPAPLQVLIGSSAQIQNFDYISSLEPSLVNASALIHLDYAQSHLREHPEQTHVWQEQTRKACELLLNLACQWPENPILQVNLAWAFRFQQDAEQAFLHGQKAIGLLLHPHLQLHQWQDMYSFVLPFGINHFSMEWERCSYAFILEPDHLTHCYRNLLLWNMYQLLGNILALLGQWASAELLYREALHLYPQFGELNYQLAEVLLVQERRTEAITAYMTGLKEKAYSSPAWLHLIALLVEEKRYAEALQWCDEADLFFGVFPKLQQAREQLAQLRQAAQHQSR